MNAAIITKRLKPGENFPHGVFAEYPVFEPDQESKIINKINAETERFISSAINSASGGIFVSITNHLYLYSNNLLSFSLDVQRRSEASLLFLRRFCFNWDVLSGVLIPLEAITREHRRLRRENNGSDDFNITPQNLFMQKNTFTSEAGANCRRSQYKKFLTAVPYDLRSLRGGVKRGSDIILTNI